MSEDLHINGADLLRIIRAVQEGRSVAGIRVQGGQYTRHYVTSFIVVGQGWTLYASMAKLTNINGGHHERVFALNLIGERERFEEDFILGKMMVG